MKKVFLYFLGLVLITALFVYFFLQNTKPTYAGELSIDGLTSQVEIKYDSYGIPHIYANNEADAYMALEIGRAHV